MLKNNSEICHHCRKRKMKTKLVHCKNTDCNLAFWYDCMTIYKPNLSFKKFLAKARGTSIKCNLKPWLVCTDQCFCKTCQFSFVEEDMDAIEYLLWKKMKADQLSSNFQKLRPRNKKDIIKQNNWAIWSFRKSLETEAPKINGSDKVNKTSFKETKELTTIDTLSANSPINQAYYEENKQDGINNVLNFSSVNKTRTDNYNERYVKFAKYETDEDTEGRQGVEPEAVNYEHQENVFSPLTILLPFLKQKSTKSKSSSSSKTKRKGRKYKPVFIIEKVK